MDATERRGSNRHLDEIGHKCRSLLASLELPTDIDILGLCTHVGNRRGRPIYPMPIDMPASHPCGIYVASREADFIFYDSNTSKPHQGHIILHELGHIVCCHRGSGVIDNDTAQLFFPDLDPEIVQDMLGRATYSNLQEKEAEFIATLMLEQVTRAPLETARSTSSIEVSGVVDRIERSLGSSRDDKR